MKFLVGLFLGLGLGVVIGLLIAPQPGKETREQLAEQGVRNLVDKLIKQYE